MPSSPRTSVYLSMLTMLLFGPGIPIFNKMVYLTSVDGEKFEHPYLQCSLYSLGIGLCLFIYLLSKKRKSFEHEVMDSKESVPPLYKKYGKTLFIIPGVIDVCASLLNVLGIMFTAPSVFQILKGGSIIVIVIYSLIFLKRSYKKHQWLGLFLTILGLCNVGVVSVLYKAESAKNPVLGIICMVTAQFFSGAFYVIEEVLVSNIEINPLQVCGIEGVVGTTIFILVLPILNSVPCEVENICNGGYIEDSLGAFEHIGENKLILFYMFMVMLCVGVSDANGVFITKNAGALARSIVSNCRIVIVWIISIGLGWETFLWSELVGFLIMILGSLIYNEILVFKCLDFKTPGSATFEYHDSAAEVN